MRMEMTWYGFLDIDWWMKLGIKKQILYMMVAFLFLVIGTLVFFLVER